MTLIVNLMQASHLFNRQPHCAALGGEGVHDGLTDPPDGIGDKFNPPFRVETLGGLNQADITLVDDVY